MSFFDVQSITPKSPAEGVEIRVIPGEKMTFAYFNLEPGSVVPEHSHPHEQMGIVAEGEGDLYIDGEIKNIKKGTSFYVPPNAMHNFDATGDKPAVLFECFTPPREDYLEIVANQK